MTKTIEAKKVREARAEARRMARTTQSMSYQQALDHVAREAGAPHWSGFVSLNPPTAVAEQAPEAGASAPTVKPRPHVSDYVRSLVTGRRGAEADRLRSAAAVYEAEELAGGRKGMWLIVTARILLPSLLLMTVGAIGNAIGGDAFTPWKGVLGVAGTLAAVNATVFGLCLAIGDHPGMEHRRAQAWTTMWWLYVAGFAVFMFGGVVFSAKGVFGLSIGTTAMVVVTIGLLGDELRSNLHTLMALGASLGPSSPEGGSLADLSVVDQHVKSDAPRPAPLTPEMARELGRRKPWHKRIGIFEIVGIVLGVACICAFVGAGLTLMGADARPFGYAALAVLGPVFAASMIFTGWRHLADVLHLSDASGLTGRVRRIARTKKMRH